MTEGVHNFHNRIGFIRYRSRSASACCDNPSISSGHANNLAEPVYRDGLVDWVQTRIVRHCTEIASTVVGSTPMRFRDRAPWFCRRHILIRSHADGRDHRRRDPEHDAVPASNIMLENAACMRLGLGSLRRWVKPDTTSIHGGGQWTAARSTPWQTGFTKMALGGDRRSLQISRDAL
jgi:hypothetical protein